MRRDFLWMCMDKGFIYIIFHQPREDDKIISDKKRFVCSLYYPNWSVLVKVKISYNTPILYARIKIRCLFQDLFVSQKFRETINYTDCFPLN